MRLPTSKLAILSVAAVPLLPALVHAADPPAPDRFVQRCGTGSAAHGDSLQATPEEIFAVEDIPGNAYPRKHTLYMNFIGDDLLSGADNSAESRSTLARQGPYPAFSGDEATAIAAVQGVQNDVAAFGIRVIYEARPPKILPYTMAMIGGSWTDTNLEMPAGGVAPIADCGALGQRHVVYVFADGGWGATSIANVTSQEAGHAWGLDHNLNCGSVMSYCGGGDGVFSSTCDGLCEEQCQGSAGCRLTHEMFCGEGSDQQNEAAELAWLFGGNEPDLEAPIADIVEPADGTTVEAGASVDVRAIVEDNYGGFGWRFIIERDGEIVYDEVAYDKDTDEQYRAAVNLVGIEAGEYVISLEVMDHGDHVSTDSVTLHVVAGADTGGTPADGEGTASDDGATSGVGDSTGEGTGSDDGDAETGTDVDQVDQNKDDCACTSDRAPARGFAWMIVLALARRRSRAA